MTQSPTLAPPAPASSVPTAVAWDTELLVLHGADRGALVDGVRALLEFLDRHSDVSLTDLAFTVNTELPPGGCRLAVVAGNLTELRTRLARCVDRLGDPNCESIRDTGGLYFFSRPLGLEGQVAFLFPGEGAQYPGMLRDVASAFPEAARFLDEVDSILTSVREGEPTVSSLFLNRSEANSEALSRLDNAMLAVLLADGALHRVLTRLGLQPAFAAGHSMGEMAALSAAGSIENDDAYLERFGKTMKVLERQEAESVLDCVLLAVGGSTPQIAEVLASLGDPPVYLAMDNCPHQTVLVGEADPISRIQDELHRRGLVCERLPFRRPYHTPLFEPMLGPLRELFANVQFHTPRIPVFSCTTGEPFPPGSDNIRDLAIHHWAAPVRFTRMIEAMHEAGARLFVEVGPRGNLSAFVEDILRGKRFAALPANVARRSGLTQLNHLAGQLVAHQVPIDLSALYADRKVDRVAFSETGSAEAQPGTGEATGEVMERYFLVMEQFLDVEREITEAYLRGGSILPESPMEPDLPAPPGDSPEVRPLLGEVVRLEPGQEILTRRVLDLEEDLFVHDHTVGGRQVSRIDPEQHGVPVMPMTFTLAMLADTARALVPGTVVLAMKGIRLLRWLAFDVGEPSTVEVSARILRVEEDGSTIVSAEARALGPVHAPRPAGVLVARGQVILAPEYPPAPAAGEFPVTNERPVTLSVEQVYHNLFHGPRFQGVRRTMRGGDEGIEAEVEVLPRGDLFRSTDRPVFPFDPVLLDVVLHPLATWHLHQPDLAGRIMLPVGLESVEFFQPPADPGTRLVARSWVSEATVRAFSHRGEALAADGTAYLRIDGIKCWRFYVPFGEVNFHGPKDQYFLARRWSEIESQAKAGKSFALVRLEVPPDLKQPAMNRVTAQVTLTPTELQEFTRRTRVNEQVHDWLFERIAAKDALRLLWHDRTQERLYPADIACESPDGRHYRATFRGDGALEFDPAVVTPGTDFVVALSAAGPVLGVAASVVKDDTDLDAELRDCARRALVSALGEEEGITITSGGADRWVVRGPAGEDWVVYTARDRAHLVAWTLGERPTP